MGWYELNKDLRHLLPRDKCDVERAEALVALDWEDAESALPEVLEWLQDLNWPVAAVFQPFLVKAGARLAPFLRPIFDADDDIWKYNILVAIASHSSTLADAIRPELQRLASNPTANEQIEGVTEEAQNILSGTA